MIKRLGREHIIAAKTVLGSDEESLHECRRPEEERPFTLCLSVCLRPIFMEGLPSRPSQETVFTLAVVKERLRRWRTTISPAVALRPVKRPKASHRCRVRTEGVVRTQKVYLSPPTVSAATPSSFTSASGTVIDIQDQGLTGAISVECHRPLLTENRLSTGITIASGPRSGRCNVLFVETSLPDEGTSFLMHLVAMWADEASKAKSPVTTHAVVPIAKAKRSTNSCTRTTA